MKTTTTIVSNLVLVLISGTSLATDFTGITIPPLPLGWEEKSGACIAGSLGADKMCNYSIGKLQSPNHTILYIGKSIPRVGSDKGHWIITDQMPYPETSQGQQVVYLFCQRHEKPDETIVAIVSSTDTEWYTIVRRAYKTNLNTGRFEEISPTGIRCLNMAGDYEP